MVLSRKSLVVPHPSWYRGAPQQTGPLDDVAGETSGVPAVPAGMTDIDALLATMTLPEKAGQLNMLAWGAPLTGAAAAAAPT